VGARCLGAGPKVWEPQYSNNSLLTSQFPNKMSWFQIPHPGNRFVQRFVQVTASPTVPPLHPQLHTLLTTTPSYLLSADTPSTKKKLYTQCLQFCCCSRSSSSFQRVQQSSWNWINKPPQKLFGIRTPRGPAPKADSLVEGVLCRFFQEDRTTGVETSRKYFEELLAS
jgi:hypothetical protein